jgi:hypothetical protein
LCGAEDEAEREESASEASGDGHDDCAVDGLVG